MKSKDLGFFTKHVEKLIVGTGLLLLAAILFLYVIGSPYAVNVKGQKLDAAALEEQIVQKSNDLNTRLNTYKDFPDIKVFPWGSNFQARLQDDASSIEQLKISIGYAGLGPEANVVIQVPAPFDVPHPPLPTNPIVNSSYAVFNPQASEESMEPQVVQAIYKTIGSPPPNMPADFPYVSVEADFDLDEWINRLEAASAGANPMPRAFWRGNQFITAVYLERQELNPATGEWSDPVIVTPLPNQLAYTPEYTRNYTDQEARAFIEFIKQSQEQIARPPFVPVAAHARQWLPPDRAGNLTPEEHRELEKLNRTISRLEKSITNAQEQLARAAQQAALAAQRAAGRPAAAAARRPQPAAPDFGGEEFGDGGGGRNFAARQPAAPAAGNNLTREQELQQKLQRDLADLQENRKKLNELLGVELDVAGNALSPYGMPGMNPEMMLEDPAMYGEMGEMYGEFGGYGAYGGYGPYGPGAQPAGRPTTGAARTGRGGAAGVTPATPEEAAKHVISVWAHDLSIQRGKTYRYRLCVSVLNPLFRQARVEESQKSENFNKISLGPSREELQAMPWTDPVVIPPAYQFFFTSGSANQQIAHVEVWRYYDGKPRSEEFDITPGDPIGGKTEIDGITIDMNVDAVLVDLVTQAGGRSGIGGAGTKMLYIQTGSPQIQSRSLEADKNSDDRLRLDNERRIIETLTGGGLASTAP